MQTSFSDTPTTHDLQLLSRLRFGQGYDVHRLVEDRPLMLGGLAIESSPLGSLGHSDGDVVLHALMDAMISACGLPGDIGSFFPPDDMTWKNANSLKLLQQLLPQLPAMHWLQVDVTIFLEAPKLKQYKLLIAETLKTALGVQQVSIKAKTAEGLGAVGQQQAVAASVFVVGVTL